MARIATPIGFARPADPDSPRGDWLVTCKHCGTVLQYRPGDAQSWDWCCSGAQVSYAAKSFKSRTGG